MKSAVKYLGAAIFLFWPAMAKAQGVGQVECPRGDGYVYLYSSMTTLEVRSTLPCGEQVQIIVRYDTYFEVRTIRGDTGFVPLNSILLVKAKTGPAVPQPPAERPARPRIAYDPMDHTEATPKPRPDPSELILPNATPIHLKLSKTISSATAHVGDLVELEVIEDIAVDDLTVISRGAMATGMVKEAEPKKRLGHSGKLGFLIYSVRLSDNEKAATRSYQESNGENGSAGAILPLASGKDVVFTQGMEFTAYIDGDIHLKRAAFQASKDNTNQTPTSAAQNPSRPRQ
jgi:hypothetical protein